MLKWFFIGAVALFVCYHFYPRETVKDMKKVSRITQAAVHAGVNEATSSKK